MEYLHKIINFLDGTTNQTHKYRTKTWIEINDTKTGSSEVLMLLIKLHFKMSMKWSHSCDFGDANTRVRGTITNTGVGAKRQVDERNKPLRIIY